MSRHVYIVEDRKSNGWWTLLMAAFIVAYSKDLLVFALFALVIYGCLQYLGNRESKKNRQMLEEVSEPKQYQDSLYGKYEPYTMPLTYPICDTFPYRDIDDGLREWK